MKNLSETELSGQTLIRPDSVPHITMSFAVRKLVILLPADNLPTFCCDPLNHIWNCTLYSKIKIVKDVAIGNNIQGCHMDYNTTPLLLNNHIIHFALKYLYPTIGYQYR